MTQKLESRELAKFAPALFLLTISFIINYVCLGNSSVAGPLIKRDFQLSDSELGILFSAFFCTYTAMQFLIGWLVDRINASWILASGFLLWSLATATTAIVRGFAFLLAIRFILGIGESVALPCGSKILAENLPEHYRGFGTGWLQELAILRGYPPPLVRKSAMVIGFSMATVGLLGCALAGSNSYIPWLLAAGFGCGMTGPGLYTFPQTLAGSAAVGKWYGWQNGFANFAGITGPALTGFVLQHTGKFFAPFAITAAICICGALAWVLIVGRVEEVKWADRKVPVLAVSNANV